ncbi:hypothetical protein TVAG_409710 [Trichomonas vaginalis G3]|uniref:Uncharacterized protein n=1 Tax=Trichomonas vaginalis (strain ATCC PRA-98 / G3) TaxID=412133 RepID=A2F8D1_TRIV3|nr:glycine-rich protein family [Trichomonas vaginalis G3]EAX98833.1 hypothetical protein TVAG_409710 [Trichomonas vaginalis G3]KAI5532245.1 glycine-rich protein family [Trichomonas vaginalis G3]|eukprot:XP_001311763.1 hypothetical protein [Trichomonas vaginalis G3]
MYSVLSDLEIESNYKINNKYEFLLHYPEVNGINYNWWRQTLSPTIQTENLTQQNSDDHFVLGYEVVDVHFTDFNWGGLSLTKGYVSSYINGNINLPSWHYAIGAYGFEKGIPGPFGSDHYLNFVALYAKINSLNMIRCNTIKAYRNSFLNSNVFLYVFNLM